MSTYTESTGYEVIDVDVTSGYNAWTRIYTCPVGKFAVIQMATGRMSSGSTNFDIRMAKYGYGDSLTYHTTNGSSIIGTDLYFFGNLITYNGSSQAVSGSNMNFTNQFQAERFLQPGEGIDVKHEGFGRTGLYRLRIELFTAQV